MLNRLLESSGANVIERLRYTFLTVCILVSGLLTGVFAAVYYMTIGVVPALLSIIVTGIFLFAYALIRSSYQFVGTLLFVSGFILNVVVMTLLLSNQTGFHYYFVTMPFLLGIVFDYEKRPEWISAAIFLVCSFLLFFVFTFVSSEPLVSISQPLLAQIKTATESIVFIITFVGLGYLSYQLVNIEKKVLHAATYDDLTNTFNRKEFFDRAENEWKRAKRSGKGFSLCVIDLDYFKSVNDRWGHSVGDKVLVEFATQVKATARVTDIFGRVGGEEFALLLPETEHDQAMALAQRIRSAIEQHSFSLRDIELNLTVSIGVSSFDTSAESFKKTYNLADKALYAAKAAGRNCVIAYQWPMHKVR